MPEITKGTSLYELIVKLVVNEKPKTILEIGSANGLGSTQAFIEGIEKAGLENDVKMVCLEMHPERFVELLLNTQDYLFVKCIKASSTGITKYMTQDDIDKFMDGKPYSFNIVRYYSKDTVKKWREEEIKLIAKNGIDQNGLEQAVNHIGNDLFDMVLIDGSAFTATHEFWRVFGAKIIIMDDTRDIKCWEAMKLIKRGGKYSVIEEDGGYRNGYAAFRRY